MAFYHSEFEKQTLEAFMDNKTIHPLILLLTPGETADLHSFQKANHHFSQLRSWYKSEMGRTGNEDLVLKKLFRKVHRDVFHEYELYSPFDGIIQDGKYNCVSGTAFFAYLLNGLGYKPEIWETPYHVYLTIKNSAGDKILIESTDPVFGFVRSKSRIEELEAIYSKFEGDWSEDHARVGSPDLSSDDHSFYKEQISLFELNGLQYLNMGVIAIEEGNMPKAFSYISKADFFYPSPRTKALLRLFDH